MSRYAELTYAVRWRVLLRHSGELFVALAVLVAVPGFVTWGLGDLAAGIRYLGVSALLVVAGAALTRLPAERSMQRNEALAIVGLMFVLAPALLVWPLSAAGLSVIDSFFEAVSGVTTTGLSVVRSVEDVPRHFLFTRAWLQWLGGLGFVVLGSALLLPPGSTAKRLVAVQVPPHDLVGGTKTHARRVLSVYAGITVVGILLVWLGGASFFDAVVSTLASVSTGGFSTADDSAAGLPLLARCAVLLLFFLGATPFALWWELRPHGWRSVLRDPQLIALTVTCVAVSLLLFGLMSNVGTSWSERLGHAVFTGFSAQTTTGFSTVPIEELGPAALLVIIFAMFVGGSAGSTAGGIKLVRLLILLRVAQLFLARTALPQHAFSSPRLAGRRLDEGEVRSALLLILLFVVVVVFGWLMFLIAGHEPLESLFDVVSATGTVGLSTGVVGPDLAPGLKLLLCGSMLLGRLELIAILVLLYPRTWLGRRRRT